MSGIATSLSPNTSGDEWDTVGAWRRSLIALGLVLAVLIFSYLETIGSAFLVWMNSETHRFSLLIIPMSLYVIWERRHQLQKLEPSPNVLAVVLAVPFGGLWLVAEIMHVALATQIAVLGLMQTALLGLLGWRVYRALLFPFMFLWLLVPAGDSLTPWLIDLTTRLTAAGVALFGLAVSTDGNIVISEAGRIGIVADCSALDFLIGNLVLSLFYANIVYSHMAKRIIYVVCGLLIAILANNVRTTSVILITYWTDGEWDLLSDHLLYGWLLFLTFVVIQMTVGSRFKDPRKKHEPIAATTHAKRSIEGRVTWPVATLALVALTLLPPQTIALRIAPMPPPPGLMLDAPEWLDPHTAQANDWQPVFHGTQATLFSSHRLEHGTVELFVGYYWQQNEHAEMIGWPNKVHDDKTWHFLDRLQHTALRDGQPFSLTETRLRGPDRSRRLTWHWYWVDGRFINNPLVAKLLHAKATLLGGDTRSAVIVLSSVVRSDRETARRALQAMLDYATFVKPLLEGAGRRQLSP